MESPGAAKGKYGGFCARTRVRWASVRNDPSNIRARNLIYSRSLIAQHVTAQLHRIFSDRVSSAHRPALALRDLKEFGMRSSRTAPSVLVVRLAVTFSEPCAFR